MKKILVAVMLVLTLALAASAVSLTYSLVPYDAEAGEYDLVVNLAMGNEVEKANTFATTIEFNTEAIGPISTDAGNILPAEVTVGSGRNEKTYSFNMVDEKWTEIDTGLSLLAACYTSDFDQFDCTSLDILTIPCVLAEGVAIDDLKATDIVVVQAYLSTNYGEQSKYGFNDPMYDNPFEDVVQPIEAKPETKLTIPVAAGDIVYLQDGTYVVVAEANEAFEIPATDGLVVVNSGYEAQKVYTVADGAVTEDTAKADGVLATGEASIRDDEVASGLRFKSTFLTALKGVVTEYGYITTVESAYNALLEGYVLDMALVAAGKAVKDVAYDAETDIFWNVEDDKTVVTAVVTNVPMTKEGVTTNVVIRPYYLVNGITVYGEPMTRTVYEVALNIKTNDAETYAKYQEYIDEIIALVEGTDTDVVIDFGPLFK